MKIYLILKKYLKIFGIELLKIKIVRGMSYIFFDRIDVYRYICVYYINRGEIQQANNIVEVAIKDTKIFGFEHHLTQVYYLQGEYKKAIELIRRSEEFRRDSLLNCAVDVSNLQVFTPSVFSPIGHIGLIDIYIKAQILGLSKTKKQVLFGPIERYSNKSLIEYWAKYINVIETSSNLEFPPAIIESVEERISLIRNHKDELLPLANFGAMVQLEWERKGYESLLSLSKTHVNLGWAALQTLGLPGGAWFCGLHVREGDDRLRDARNASIDTYDLAIDEIIARGGWVIRMGDKSMGKLEQKHGLIDLPYTDYNLDWMNLFVWAEGNFLIGTGSGPVVLPLCFGKGVAIANWAPLASRQWGYKDILLPKHYFNTFENRYLSPEERMSDKYGYLESISALRDLGIEIHDNSQEEIRDLVVEMIEFLAGNEERSDFQIEIQKRFDRLASNMGIYPTKIARIFSNKYL